MRAMRSDRGQIWSLLALGRITPREAERLLVLSMDEDEAALRLAVCVAVVWIVAPHLSELVQGLAHVVQVIAPQVGSAVRSVAEFLTGWWRGVR